MLALNRKALLKRDDLKIEKVQLSAEEFVYVRQMTGRERDDFERLLTKEVTGKDGKPQIEKALEDFRAKLAVTTVCDENGNMLLEPGDFTTLSKNMSAYKLEKIVNVATKLNAITEEDKEALVKNSTAVQPADSTSDSVSN